MDVVAQALSGAFVIFSRLSLASALSHAALMARLFAALADGARRTMAQRRGEAQRRYPPAMTRDVLPAR